MSTAFFKEYYALAGFTLIRLRSEDAQPIAAKLATMNPWQALNYSAQQLESYLLATDPALYRYTVLTQDNNAIAGIVAVRHPWLRGPYLELIGVFPERQQHGMGTAILEWFERETQSRAHNLWVLVSAFNESAKRFYLRFGFTEIGRIDALVDPQSTEILLRKTLRSLAPPAKMP